MNFSDIQAELRHFAAERDWQPFHSPKNLSTALMVEAAELAEIFQWMTPEQSQAAARSPEDKERIGDEVADVLLYLLQLADHCEIDIAKAATDKLARNALKYPALRAIARVSPSNASVPGAHVLLDYENVQPTEAELRALAPEASQVWVFHGPHQRQVEHRFAGYGDHVTAVPISKTGKNALDFHLSFYMGYIASRNPAASLIVVANDRGYEPMLEHARAMGFSARQLGYGKPMPGTPPAPVASARARKSSGPAVKKAAAKKQVVKAAPPAKKATAKKTAARNVAPASGKQAAATGATTEKKTLPAKKVVPAKKAAAKSVAKRTAGQPLQATKGPKGHATGTSSVAQKTARAEPRATTRNLTDSLRRMGVNRPSKPKSLWRALKSFLGPDVADEAVELALERLIGAGIVRVDTEKGVFYPTFAA